MPDLTPDILRIDLGTLGLVTQLSTWLTKAHQGERFLATDTKQLFIATTTAGASDAEYMIIHSHFPVEDATNRSVTPRTLVLSDAAEYIIFTNGADNQSIVIPANSVVPLPKGTLISGACEGGSVDFTINTDTLVSLVDGGSTTGFTTWSLIKVTDTRWHLTGS